MDKDIVIAGRLTPRQRRFAALKSAGLSGSEAARQAGYSPNGAGRTAYRLMRDPRVREALAHAEASEIREVATAATLNESKVLDGLLTEAMRTGPGSTHAARVSAWRAAGESMGMFRSKGDPTGLAALQAVRIEIVLPDQAETRSSVTVREAIAVIE